MPMANFVGGFRVGLWTALRLNAATQPRPCFVRVPHHAIWNQAAPQVPRAAYWLYQDVMALLEGHTLSRTDALEVPCATAEGYPPRPATFRGVCWHGQQPLFCILYSLPSRFLVVLAG